MAGNGNADLRREAIGWRIRLRDGGAEEWESFAAWLEEDPARSAAYDAVAAADQALRAADVPPPRLSANDDFVQPTGRSVRRWILAGGAVALVAGIVGLTLGDQAPAPTEIATAAGEHRTITLADGTAVALNGGTRLRVGGGDRKVEMVSGEATFTVRHDSRRPFEVRVDGRVVRDAGTVFNLLSDRGRFSLEVIEGAVEYDPGGTPTRLSAGQALRGDGEGRSVSTADPKIMAGWRSGQLNYDLAPLSAVISDLSRTTGATVSLDPSLDQLPFTGSIRIDPDHSVTVRRLAEALGVVAVGREGRWRLEPHRRARR
ncbi:MAG: FecR domain-containing protein [Alphaproteobacteria bacterium]|nr:FecR domain-containing protein [Alphaproteobacteria bacterium]MBV9370080.1 FecR domain-containing protein [Alphaproteobacteria bacterium]MBV9900754.1 FecR domain-containing protein [Alphaproteobacteria bacterium]